MTGRRARSFARAAMALVLSLLPALEALAQPAAQPRPIRRKRPAAEAPAPVPKPAIAPPNAQEAPLTQFSEVIGALAFLADLCAPDTRPNPWQRRMEAFLEAEGDNSGLRERLTGAYNQGFSEYSTSYRQCTPAARAARAMLTRDAARLARELDRRFGS
ncbi:MAG: TIGR02301 family protein [Rhabdaerophilum calidifontis]